MRSRRLAEILLLAAWLMSLWPGDGIPGRHSLQPIEPGSDERENCRLFGMIKALPEKTGDLNRYLERFAGPSRPQRSGWSLSIFSDYEKGGTIGTPGLPMILRSEMNVRDDLPTFEMASELFLRLKPNLILGHLRNASSGCLDIVDPHPFQSIVRDRHFLFIHNGGVWGEDLIVLTHDLLGGESAPANCPDVPVDSEYLFLYYKYILENIASKPYEACRIWLTSLIASFNDEWNALNVLITDGYSIWAIRSSRNDTGFNLHYKSFDNGSGYLISTEALDPDFILLDNFTIAQFRPGEPPRIETVISPFHDIYTHPRFPISHSKR
ncbi:class II glutamine amidotransferase [bacterium]|nr:class II glutamine amidotransferase [candidate division CSSED10-310 bacterium]